MLPKCYGTSDASGGRDFRKPPCNALEAFRCTAHSDCYREIAWKIRKRKWEAKSKQWEEFVGKELELVSA